MKTDLDCSYRVPWTIEVYHDAQEFAYKWGLKWCYMEGDRVYSLRLSHFYIGLREDTAKRFRRWLIHVQGGDHNVR